MKIANIMPLLIIAVYFSPSEIISASTPAIPAIAVTIHYKARGAVDVFRAVDSAAAEAGFTCAPSVEAIDRLIMQYHGKGINPHAQMVCSRPSFGTVSAVAFNYTAPGQVEVWAYYNPDVPPLSVRPVIDGVIDRIEAILKADPLISAMEQAENVASRPVVSKIK